jgi:2-oxoglutarate dehydrogenase E1 component
MDDLKRSGVAPVPWSSSPLSGANAAWLEALYEQYLLDPGAVEPVWREWFERLPPHPDGSPDVLHSRLRAAFRALARQPKRFAPAASTLAPAPAGTAVLERARKQVRVLQLINAYRYRGHQAARLDPLGLTQPVLLPELTLEYYGLGEADLDTEFETGSLVGPRRASLREILARLRETYTGTIGAEYMHLTDTGEKRWIQSVLEGVRARPVYPAEVKRRVLERLIAAESLEHYLHNKYVGQKRFSLEGAESLIPMLDELLQRAGSQGVQQVVIGMAHRGRLNVLVNIVGKSTAELFLEFEGKARALGTGDVKYHLGYSSDIATPGGIVHVALAFNPSHLEIVDPVVEGSVRARQERLGDRYGARVLPVLIHGDAAFIGQGVVQETLNLSQLRGYSTKGTVHIVVNNQIGFTTSLQQDARSTLYPTDIAKMVAAPIFHVNGDDPEAALFAIEVALDYRMTFRKDVVVDLVCYRRHGHSEADEPAVTQPVMYQRIRSHPTTPTLYARRLLEEGVIEEGFAAKARADYVQALEAGRCVVPNFVPKEQARYAHAADWHPYQGRPCDEGVATGVDLETLRALSERLTQLPAGFEPHPQVARVLDNRRKMAAGALPVDWGYAENLAYATLLREGFAVRLSGQDSARGTFFHRHAVIYNQKDGTAYVPLRNLYEGQPNFRVVNSPLSEEAVLAFEYGYATTDPKTLVIWEAQFGDFANNAQVVIDQFISAGEQKWGRLCGLVLFLPHGYEGQGPEHSSARLERYLQLCAQENMIVCQPTTPAQLFHLLRRQMHGGCRKPLVVMTPKSMLRHRLSTSRLEDMTQGRFEPVLGELDPLDPDKVHRVILCSGKVYYDLLEERRRRGREDVAILRLEQLYPFPEERLRTVLKPYGQVPRFLWAQEEPRNQGAWFYVAPLLRALLPQTAAFTYAGRPLSAAPAVGDYSLHVQQLQDLLDQALGPGDKIA